MCPIGAGHPLSLPLHALLAASLSGSDSGLPASSHTVLPLSFRASAAQCSVFPTPSPLGVRPHGMRGDPRGHICLPSGAGPHLKGSVRPIYRGENRGSETSWDQPNVPRRHLKKELEFPSQPCLTPGSRPPLPPDPLSGVTESCGPGRGAVKLSVCRSLTVEGRAQVQEGVEG